MCEFSRIVELKKTILEKKFVVQANSGELQALASRFDVYRIDALRIEYFITEKNDIIGAYILIANINSSVVKFVIDNREENLKIDEQFDVVLVSEDMARNNYEELKEFDIEIFGDERKVDVGEIASQYLSLCIYM